jgi:hypothetical protein
MQQDWFREALRKRWKCASKFKGYTQDLASLVNPANKIFIATLQILERIFIDYPANQQVTCKAIASQFCKCLEVLAIAFFLWKLNMKNPNINHFDKFDLIFFFNGEKKRKRKFSRYGNHKFPKYNTCVLVQIIVTQFFIVLNSELKGQEKNKSFEILFLKLKKQDTRASHGVRYILRKKNASLTVAVCDWSIG